MAYVTTQRKVVVGEQKFQVGNGTSEVRAISFYDSLISPTDCNHYQPINSKVKLEKFNEVYIYSHLDNNITCGNEIQINSFPGFKTSCKKEICQVTDDIHLCTFKLTKGLNPKNKMASVVSLQSKNDQAIQLHFFKGSDKYEIQGFSTFENTKTQSNIFKFGGVFLNSAPFYGDAKIGEFLIRSSHIQKMDKSRVFEEKGYQFSVNECKITPFGPLPKFNLSNGFCIPNDGVTLLTSLPEKLPLFLCHEGNTYLVNWDKDANEMKESIAVAKSYGVISCDLAQFLADYTLIPNEC